MLSYILLVGLFLFNINCINCEYCNPQLSRDEISWLLKLQRNSGTFLLNFPDSETTRILPYVTNLALWNILRVNTSSEILNAVKRYLNWYITHINTRDKWGLTGTMYDFVLNSNKEEVPINGADSTDSYAATFLSLLKSYLDASGDRSWIIDNKNTIKVIADVIWATYNSDIRLTYARPDYKEAYLMDNVEVWRGLEDYSLLLSNINDPNSEHYHYRAELIRNGIYYNLWNPSRNEYQVAYNKPPVPVNWSNFYANTTANLWPMIFKLPDAMLGTQRKQIYDKFKQTQLSSWQNLKSDDFPWTSLHEAVALNEAPQNARTILSKYRENIMAKYYPNRPSSTWTIGESAWFTLLLSDNNCS